MTPKVTVLMPVHNGAQYLVEAIDSVIGQTFTDYEFMIIDDASTDDSRTLIGGYDDDRICLVRNETNLGQVRSLNKGLRLARGKYVARIDQDDSSLPPRLERQVAVLDADQSVAVVGTWVYNNLDPDGKRVDVWPGRVDDRADYLFALLSNTLPIYHTSVMLRRDAVMQVQGYDERVPYCEDLDLWLRLALARYDARVISEPLTHYRIHEGMQSHSRHETQWKNAVLSQERFIKVFADEHAAGPLRMLLMRHDSSIGLTTQIRDKPADFWEVCSSPSLTREYCGQLDCMLGNMRTKLHLNALQFRKLTRLVHRQAARAAGRAWRVGITRQWSSSFPLYLFSLRGGLAMASSLHAWTYPIVYAAAPLLPVLREVKRTALRSGPIKLWYSSLRQRARRSAKIRLWYRNFF